MLFGDIHDSLRDDDQNFLYVCFILIAVRIWGTIRFFMIIFESDNNELVDNIYLYLQAIGDPSQAFWNCLLFCVFDKTVRNKLKLCCTNCQINDHDEEETSILSVRRRTGSIPHYGSRP